MKYCTIALLLICFPSQVFAQGNYFDQLKNGFENQGRQVIKQEFGSRFQNPRGPGNQDVPRSFGSVPSESGKGSGGNNQIYNPGDNGFLLPGNSGGQPMQTGNPYQPGNPYPTSNPQNGQPGRFIQNGNVYSGSTYSDQELPGNPVMSGHYVMIRCPLSTQGSIRYTLSSNRGNFGFTMAAGQEQRFRAGTDWTISYNDGAEHRRYQLEGGTIYTMQRNSDNRWQIYAPKKSSAD